MRVDEHGEPVAVRLGTWRRVDKIVERWRVEEGWWRQEPLRRSYFSLLLEEGIAITVFHDNVGEGWYAQRYT